jgi:hypothetical protein
MLLLQKSLMQLSISVGEYAVVAKHVYKDRGGSIARTTSDAAAGRAPRFASCKRRRTKRISRSPRRAKIALAAVAEIATEVARR